MTKNDVAETKSEATKPEKKRKKAAKVKKRR
jgi:hypothetical protein